MSGRIYRAAWLPAIVTLLALAFTVGAPEPLPQPTLDASFDGRTAARIARDLADRFPNRAPGSPKAGEAANWVSERFADYGLRIQRQTFDADIPELGVRPLVNVLAIAPGRSPEAIVVMAHRDNLGI